MAQGDRADRLLAVMVDHLVAAGLVKRCGRVRTDSIHVLAAVRRLNRGELVAETLRTALQELSEHGEEWLARLVAQDWADWCGWPVRYDRLPRGGDALIAYVLKAGEDGMYILRAGYQGDAPPGLRDLPAVRLSACEGLLSDVANRCMMEVKVKLVYGGTVVGTTRCARPRTTQALSHVFHR